MKWGWRVQFPFPGAQTDRGLLACPQEHHLLIGVTASQQINEPNQEIFIRYLSSRFLGEAGRKAGPDWERGDDLGGWVLWAPLLSSVGAGSGPTEIPGVRPGQSPGWPLKVSSSLTLLVEEGGSPHTWGHRALPQPGHCTVLDNVPSWPWGGSWGQSQKKRC